MTKLSELFAEDVKEELEGGDMDFVVGSERKVSGEKLIDAGTIEVSRLVHAGLKYNILFGLIESYAEYREFGHSPKEAVNAALDDWAVL